MLANLSKKWTEPKISTSGKEWSVWFRFYNSDIRKWILIRRKGGANYPRLSKRERLAELHRLNLHLYNPDWHIFSKGFLPGPTRVHPNTPTTAWWRRIVKEKLKINVDLYSLKKLYHFHLYNSPKVGKQNIVKFNVSSTLKSLCVKVLQTFCNKSVWK